VNRAMSVLTLEIVVARHPLRSPPEMVNKHVAGTGFGDGGHDTEITNFSGQPGVERLAVERPVVEQ